MSKAGAPHVIDHLRRQLFGAAAALAAIRSAAVRQANAEAPLPVEGALPSFNGATAWLNSAPLTPASLRGKVVLVIRS